ncbi:MAG: hypothetical protein ACO3QP_09530, partial [Burkholderiaceae bacterium]
MRWVMYGAQSSSQLSIRASVHRIRLPTFKWCAWQDGWIHAAQRPLALEHKCHLTAITPTRFRAHARGRRRRMRR